VERYSLPAMLDWGWTRWEEDSAGSSLELACEPNATGRGGRSR
jgi:hypothetical protein